MVKFTKNQKERLLNLDYLKHTEHEISTLENGGLNKMNYAPEDYVSETETVAKIFAVSSWIFIFFVVYMAIQMMLSSNEQRAADYIRPFGIDTSLPDVPRVHNYSEKPQAAFPYPPPRQMD